jgi:hypothetical protein
LFLIRDVFACVIDRDFMACNRDERFCHNIAMNSGVLSVELNGYLHAADFNDPRASALNGHP